eukprot:1629048-Amphidinium_carterae.1
MADPFSQLAQLERQAVSAQTLTSYRRALQLCRRYLSSRRIAWNPNKPEMLDRALAAYLTHLNCKKAQT